MQAKSRNAIRSSLDLQQRKWGSETWNIREREREDNKRKTCKLFFQWRIQFILHIKWKTIQVSGWLSFFVFGSAKQKTFLCFLGNCSNFVSFSTNFQFQFVQTLQLNCSLKTKSEPGWKSFRWQGELSSNRGDLGMCLSHVEEKQQHTQLFYFRQISAVCIVQWLFNSWSLVLFRAAFFSPTSTHSRLALVKKSENDPNINKRKCVHLYIHSCCGSNASLSLVHGECVERKEESEKDGRSEQQSQSALDLWFHWWRYVFFYMIPWLIHRIFFS